MAPVAVPSFERKTVRRLYAAEVLDVTPRTVDRLVAAGKLEAVYVGSLKMITVKSLKALQDGRG
jgi:excisionase family DNA binding protein